MGDAGINYRVYMGSGNYLKGLVLEGFACKCFRVNVWLYEL